MNLNNSDRELIQLEDIILETASVAMIRQNVAEISKQNNLVFKESFDDLDFLVYTTLSFSNPNSRVGLICRSNSAVSGIEVCVRHDEQHQNIALLVYQTLQKLSLDAEDLIWIHPYYEEEIHKLLEQAQPVSESKQLQQHKIGTGLASIDRLREIRDRWGTGKTSTTNRLESIDHLNKREEELGQESFSESTDLINSQRASNHEKH
jgi:hypothetical protein